MMKRIYAIAAVVSVMLASCTEGTKLNPETQSGTPITVTAGVAELSTRAGHDSDNLPETFYLTVVQDSEDKSIYNYVNVLMTKGSGNEYTASDGTTLLWKDSNHEAYIGAYTTAGTTFTVQTDQRTAANVLASDLLGAISGTNGDVTISDDNISIAFRHLLCKLNVTYSWGTEMDAEMCKITDVTYKGFGTSATLDRSNSSVTAGETTGNIKAYVADNTSECIFTPTVSDPVLSITISNNSEDKTCTVTVPTPTDGFQSDYRYTMNVQIGADKVEIGTISATAWTPEDGGSVETE